MTPPTWTHHPASLTLGEHYTDGSGVVRVHLRAGVWIVDRDGSEWGTVGEAVGWELERCVEDLPW